MRHEYYTPEKILQLVGEKENSALKSAIVLGCEESGLSNEDLELCDCVSSVPLAASYPSLNLSQAVMIYAYVLAPLSSSLRGPSGIDEPQEQATGDLSFRALKERAAVLLDRLPGGTDLISRRILERLAVISGHDIKLAHSLCAKIEKELDMEK